ncbi:MAG: DUF1841 family protein [Francisellaceae bacterium]
MIFDNQNRAALRQSYFDVWHKLKNQRPLTSLESQIADVLKLHPEYHILLENADHIDKDYPPELNQTNPFLHMGLHLAVLEQINTDRPAGIARIYQTAILRSNPHQLQHQMMEALAEMIWLAQKNNTIPNEQDYLDNLQLRLT